MASEAAPLLPGPVRVAVARWREVNRAKVLLQERETELDAEVSKLSPEHLQMYMTVTDRRKAQ